MRPKLTALAAAIAAAILPAHASAHLPRASFCTARMPAKTELRCATRDRWHAYYTLRWFAHHRHPAPAARERSTDARGASPTRAVIIRNHRWLLRESIRRQREARARIAAATMPRSWLAAVEWVQPIWPGSRSWLRSCSASEGGWGIWVWNGGAPYWSSAHGSGAGGWMQYKEPTFWGDYHAGVADAHARGFHVPAAAASWTSPLGQAVAGGWAYGNSRPPGKWTGSGC